MQVKQVISDRKRRLVGGVFVSELLGVGPGIQGPRNCLSPTDDHLLAHDPPHRYRASLAALQRTYKYRVPKSHVARTGDLISYCRPPVLVGHTASKHLHLLPGRNSTSAILSRIGSAVKLTLSAHPRGCAFGTSTAVGLRLH